MRPQSYSEERFRQLGIVHQITAKLGLSAEPAPQQRQYAALCYRVRKKPARLEVLVATSRDTGRWIIPKGWPITGKLAHEVAAREAYEEAGMRGRTDRKALGHYRYLKRLEDGESVLVDVQVHALEVRRRMKDFPEKGMRQLEWVSCEEAAGRVMEPELQQLLMRFSEQMSPVAPAA